MAAISGSIPANLPILTGKNYENWKIQIRVVMRFQGVWAVWGMNFMGDVGEVSMVDWTFFVGGALGKGESRYWPSIILVRGILIHGVVRGLQGSWHCGYCSHSVGISLLFLCSTCPRPPIFGTCRSSIIEFAHS